MIQSCVTLSLVPEARGGPFVFWDDVRQACKTASELGFDAIEIFPPSPEALDADNLRHDLDEFGLRLAALGTGAGWVLQRLHLCDASADRRTEASAFVQSIIDAAAPFGASAIIGSMQGRAEGSVSRDQAITYLADALEKLGGHAESRGVSLFFEPLNRYETNLVNTIEEGTQLVQRLSTQNVKLLADLFHMNIEETDMAAAIHCGGAHLGHLHWVDSHRGPAGSGHLDYGPIVSALREIGYNGFASAEALPDPDSTSAARQTIETYRKYFQP